MQLRISTANGLPIYEQIVRQVKFAIANGALSTGDHVPSVRELAASAAVNPNTVARAYRELQAAGILNPVRGMGLAVTPEARKLCRGSRLEMIRERLHSVLSEAQLSEIPADDIRQMVEKELAKWKG